MMASTSHTKYQNLNPEDVASGPITVVPSAAGVPSDGAASEGAAEDGPMAGGGGTFVVHSVIGIQP